MAYTISELLTQAIPIKAWFSWIPDTILDTLPKDTRMAIIYVEDNWLAINENGKLIYGPETLVQQESDGLFQPSYKIFAALTTDPEPMPLQTA